MRERVVKRLGTGPEGLSRGFVPALLLLQLEHRYLPVQGSPRQRDLWQDDGAEIAELYTCLKEDARRTCKQNLHGKNSTNTCVHVFRWLAQRNLRWQLAQTNFVENLAASICLGKLAQRTGWGTIPWRSSAEKTSRQNLCGGHSRRGLAGHCREGLGRPTCETQGNLHTFHLLKNIVDFPLLVLKGICHYWKYGYSFQKTWENGRRASCAELNWPMRRVL